MPYWSLLFSAVALGMLVLAYPKLRGTTLTAPWAWSLLAVSVLAATEMTLAAAEATNDGRAGAVVPEHQSPEPLRDAAALVTLCPLVALLGGKRPQHQAWQMIVISLWGILALPAGESWLLHPADAMVVHPLRQWFVAVVILVGVANWLGTRFWISGLLLCYAHWSLLGRWLPTTAPYELSAAGSLGLIAAAIGLVWLGFPRRRAGRLSLDRLWFAFRDTFGQVWALRLAERINTTAAQNGWDVHLGRDGFRSRAIPSGWTEIPLALEDALLVALGGMLRRFVNDQWIAAALGRTIPVPLAVGSDSTTPRDEHSVSSQPINS